MNPYYKTIHSLCLYQGVFVNPIGQALINFLESLTQDNSINTLKSYGYLFNQLADNQQSWQDYLVTQILLDDNPFSRQVQRKNIDDLPQSLIKAVNHDLLILQNLYNFQIDFYHDILCIWQEKNNLDNFLHSPVPWPNALEDLANYYRQYGVGIFAQDKAFQWQNKKLVGITHPDIISLNELVGYEEQKRVLKQNTECLLGSHPALNVLLYGSRGSGKSSLVKALFNEYSAQGLRLIEVSKAALKELPLILEYLRDVPQKFIIFVDDLSFEEDDDAFKALKVVLEGSVIARAENVVVYATSNRRHLVREFFEDRPRPQDADEIHTWDTVQEKLSFSDRFGLTLTFEPSSQDTYLEIVSHLAELAELNIEPTELQFMAKQWAIRHNGRSGRTARQFIDFLIGTSSMYGGNISDINQKTQGYGSIP
jgi:predicted AAA+ superfamily ATPase